MLVLFRQSNLTLLYSEVEVLETDLDSKGSDFIPI